MAAAPVLPDAGPLADEHGVWFGVADPHLDLVGVDLVPETWDRHRRPFAFDGAARAWRVRLPRQDVDRLEYRLVRRTPDGVEHVGPDPANPVQAPGLFGAASVVTFPGYAEPAWLAAPADPGRRVEVALPSPTLGTAQSLEVWSSAGLPDQQPAPLLVALDGPDLDRLAGLTHFLAVQVGQGRLPPLRAALLPAGPDRNERYSASPTYTTALTDELLPALEPFAPATRRVGLGASLGGLALLTAEGRVPGAFAGLMLQSGSFFVRDLDGHEESGFPWFARVHDAVTARLAQTRAASGARLVLTCGRAEENLRNNRRMAAALRRQGYRVVFVENPDAHTFAGWRDTYDPLLGTLLREVLSAT